jgi:hypothetical protein
MITFAELESRVRTLYESTGTTRWASLDFLRAANEALDDLSESTGFYESFVTIPLRGKQTYYDLRGFTTGFRINFVFNTQQQIWLTPVGIGDLITPRWETVPGEPVRYMVRGAYWLGLYPRPSGDVGSVRVYFDGIAPHFRDFGSVLVSDYPDDYVDALESYMLYDLSGRDGESERAVGHWNDYHKRAKQLEAFVTQRTVAARHSRLSHYRHGYPTV